MKAIPTLIVVGLLTHVPAAQGQSIDGRVIARDTGGGVGGAHVELRWSPGAEPEALVETAATFAGRPAGAPPAIADNSRVTTTAPDGSFSFERVPPGQYRLYATRANGYIPGEYGQRTATGRGTTLSLAAGRHVAGVSLVVTPASTINGRILDGGEPSGYAHVQALRATWRNGRKHLTVAQLVQADERGIYRLFWLPPGEYVVAAKPLDLRRSSEMMHIPPPSRFGEYEQQMRPTVTAINATRVAAGGQVIESQYVPIYYPGVHEEERAQPLTVAAGQNLQGVDVDVSDSLVRTRRVRGQVIDGTTGLALPRATLEIVPRDAPAILLVGGTSTTADGQFDLGGALPGANYLVVNGGAAIVPLDVADADLNGLTVTVPPPVTIQGQIRTADGNAAADAVSGVSIAFRRNPEVRGLLEPRSGSFVAVGASPAEAGRSSASAFSDAEGRLTFRDVRPGEYAVAANLRGDAYLESVQFGGRDVLRRPIRIDGPTAARLDVVIGTDGASVSGTILDSSGAAAPGAIVVIVPDEGRHRADLFKSATADALGRFELRGVAPGDYELFAWEEMEPGAWLNPEVLRMEEGRGRRLRVAARERIIGEYRLLSRP